MSSETPPPSVNAGTPGGLQLTDGTEVLCLPPSYPNRETYTKILGTLVETIEPIPMLWSSSRVRMYSDPRCRLFRGCG